MIMDAILARVLSLEQSTFLSYSEVYKWIERVYRGCNVYHTTHSSSICRAGFIIKESIKHHQDHKLKTKLIQGTTVLEQRITIL